MQIITLYITSHILIRQTIIKLAIWIELMIMFVFKVNSANINLVTDGLKWDVRNNLFLLWGIYKLIKIWNTTINVLIFRWYIEHMIDINDACNVSNDISRSLLKSFIIYWQANMSDSMFFVAFCNPNLTTLNCNDKECPRI